MEAMDISEPIGGLSPKQIDAMKLAMAEVMKDLSGSEILPNQQQRIDENKLGMAEAIKDTGMMDKLSQPQVAKAPSESISFKDMPAEGQIQMAAQAGIQLSPESIAQQKVEDAARTIIRDEGQQVGGKNATAKGKI